MQNDTNVVGGSFQWPPTKEEEEQGPTATPMYIDPQHPQYPTVGRVDGTAPPGATVEQLLGLPEKIVPVRGPLSQSSPVGQSAQNGGESSTYSVS